MVVDVEHSSALDTQELRELRVLTAGEVPVLAFTGTDRSQALPDCIADDAFDPDVIAECALAAIPA